jgi:hypothetical protein
MTTMPPTAETAIVLDHVKPCKHSVVFGSNDKDAVIQTVYVKRPFAENAKKIRVVITVLE